MRWAGDIACIGEIRKAYILVRKVEEKNHMRDRWDGRIVIQWTS